MLTDGGAAKKRFCAEGDSVFREGDPGDAAFIVETGTIAISKEIDGERVELARLGMGELFGEMAIIDGSPRMADATAAEESVVVRIPADQFAAKLARGDPFVRALMKILVNNLRQVHLTYMRRARSVDDYINAIAFHAESIGQYAEVLDRRGAANLAADARAELAVLHNGLHGLRQVFRHHEDHRENALTEVDLQRRRPGA